MSTCQIEERDAGRSYPRTCPSCGLGKGGCTKGLDREGLRARIAALEAQLAEAWRKEGFLAEKLKQAETERDTWKERAMTLRLSALEATPPAPKVMDVMVEAASREYMRIFGKHLLSDHARLILTAAQEAGK
jgi:hypothetical protein